MAKTQKAPTSKKKNNNETGTGGTDNANNEDNSNASTTTNIIPIIIHTRPNNADVDAAVKATARPKDMGSAEYESNDTTTAMSKNNTNKQHRI